MWRNTNKCVYVEESLENQECHELFSTDIIFVYIVPDNVEWLQCADKATRWVREW